MDDELESTWTGMLPVTLPSQSEAAAAPKSGMHRLARQGEIARGGMVTVSAAFDPVLRRHVALKENLRSRAPTAERRFVNEALITAQLDHPYIVPVYDGTLLPDADGKMAYTMKLVQGVTLTEVLRRSKAARARGSAPPDLGLPALLDHFLKLCDAVAYAHERGVVHRDIKPDNVMIGPHGEVYLMDWGLAGVSGADESISVAARDMTLPGYAIGTPAYMAPEQALGQTMGPSVDQFALGLILHEMLGAGRPRESRGDLQGDLEQAAQGRVERIQAIAKEKLPRELVGIATKTLHPQPAQRYATVEALADDIRRYRANRAVLAAPDSLIQRLQRWLSQNRETTLLLLLALVVLLSGTGATLTAVTVGGATAYATWAQERETRLQAVMSTATSRAVGLERALHLAERQLEAVAGGAQALLEHGVPQEGRVLLAPSVFQDPTIRPADTAYSAAYARLLSTTWPDLVIAPDADRALAAQQARHLVPLRHLMRRAHLTMRQELDGMTEAEAERAWRDEGGPTRFVQLGTPAGLHFEMPGAYWDVKGFDPRVRPWYALGTTTSPRWGNPMQEASTGKLMVACSMQIPSSDGGMLGVANMTVSFSWLIEKYLSPPHPSVRETFVVDEEGHIIVRSSEALGTKSRPDALDKVYGMEPFPEAAVTAALSGMTGTVYADGGDTLYLHHPLSNGWWYVAQVDVGQAVSGSSP